MGSNGDSRPPGLAFRFWYWLRTESLDPLALIGAVLAVWACQHAIGGAYQVATLRDGPSYWLPFFRSAIVLFLLASLVGLASLVRIARSGFVLTGAWISAPVTIQSAWWACVIVWLLSGSEEPRNAYPLGPAADVIFPAVVIFALVTGAFTYLGARLLVTRFNVPRRGWTLTALAFAWLIFTASMSAHWLRVDAQLHSPSIVATFPPSSSVQPEAHDRHRWRLTVRIDADGAGFYDLLTDWVCPGLEREPYDFEYLQHDVHRLSTGSRGYYWDGLIICGDRDVAAHNVISLAHEFWRLYPDDSVKLGVYCGDAEFEWAVLLGGYWPVYARLGTLPVRRLPAGTAAHHLHLTAPADRTLRCTLNGTPLETLAALSEALGELPSSPRSVRITVDDHVSHAQMIEAIDALRQSEVRPIGI